MQRKIPELGVQIQCTPANIIYLNSTTPAVRIRFENDRWVVNDPNARSGMLIFIRAGNVPDMTAITITEVSHNVAFATASV